MLRYRILKDVDEEDVYEIDSEGYELLHNSILNKGAAFTEDERKLFKLDGYLPPAVSTLAQQVERSYENFSSKPSDIEKYIFLRSLQDRNETLFYGLLLDHLDEMIPIVYTPTVGLACQQYSHIFRFTRGVFLSPRNIDNIDVILQSLPHRNIEMIVATDSEGILGIGDQGIGGMGIPIGKLSLYVAGAGINPANCLPVTLDIGTDNEELLNDPLYLGLKMKRLRGEPYFDFIEKFVEGVQRQFPHTILQWEDFSKQNAFTLLDRYRDALPCFNDDIQGTGAVTLAGIRGALRIKGEKLPEQLFVIYGAGAGGIGVARQISIALREEGLSEREARERIFVLDSRGVIFDGRGGVDEYKREFARETDFAKEWNLEKEGRVSLFDTVKNAKPRVLLGFSGVAGSFSERIVREMLTYCERPIIFPLSNPTSKSEVRPEEIYRWSEGNAIVATGSPFSDVNYRGRVFKVGQGNNVFIFPGVGLGALTVKAEKITDEMFTVAAIKLSELVSTYRLDLNCVYPAVADLRVVCEKIAVEVALKAMEQKVARKPVVPKLLEASVLARMWGPRYSRITRGTEHL